MNMKKRVLSLLLCVILIVGMLPATAMAAGTAGTWDVKLNVSESDEYTYNGQNVLALGFGVQSDDLKVKTAQSMVFVVDLTIFDFLEYPDENDNENVQTCTPSTEGLRENELAPSTGATIGKVVWAPWVAYGQSPDGKTGYMQIVASSSKSSSVSSATDLATAYIGFKSSKSVKDLTRDSIRFAKPAELGPLNQSSAILITDGDKNTQYAISKDGTDTLKVTPTVVWNGIEPAKPEKPAYPGTIAAPEVDTNKHGKVTLKAVMPSNGGTVQYGYTDDFNAVPTKWQDGLEFTLPVGDTYYFFAKVVETGEYKEMVSDPSAPVKVLGVSVTSVVINKTPLTVAVPKAGPGEEKTAELPLTVTVYFDDGTDTSGSEAIAAWAYTGTLPEGVTWDSTHRKLVVTNKAKEGKVTFTATYASVASTPAEVTITKETPAETYVKIGDQIGGTPATSITIPTDSSNNRVDYSAKVYDQYGQETDKMVTWSLTPTSIPSGVTLDTTTSPGAATVVVDKNAVGGTKITLTATCTAASADLTITLNTKPTHALTAFANPAVTGTYGDTITGQTVTSTTGDVKYSSSNSGVVSVDETTGALTVRKAGDATITAKVAENATYAGASASYTVKVNQRELKITGLTATDRTYEPGNQSVTLSGGKLSGKVGKDDVSVTMPTSGTMTDADAGSDKQVNVTTPSLTGTAADNYTLKTISGITVNIAQATPDVGTVTRSAPADIYESTPLSSITLGMTGTASSSGTLKLDDGQTLTEGTKDYNWTFSPKDSKNYETVHGTISLLVKADGLTGISVSGTPKKTAYKWGEVFEATGVTITATYASGATKNVTADATIPTALTVGQTEVEVSYGGKTCKITDITVDQADARTLAPIEISQKYTVITEQSKDIGKAGMPEDAGTLTYTAGTATSTGSATIAFAVDGSTVKFTITNGADTEVITLPVTISSTNYKDSTVNVVITLTDKETQKALTITGGTEVTYGKELTLGTTGGSTNGAVTYAVTNGTGAATINGNVLKATKAGTVTVTATMAGNDDYADVTSAPVTITINKADPTGTPEYTKITTSGKTLKDANLTTGTITPEGTIKWNDAETTVVEANKSYGWTFTPEDGDNYNVKTGTIKLYTKSSSSGGGSGVATYAITVKDAKNGDVTSSHKTASAGTSVTLTVAPDKGYALNTLTVLDSKNKEIKLTQKNGKYTFTMPAGKVTVEASFRAENPFTDVPADAYYEDAVLWAVEQGITGGASATTFNPDGNCTRAQAVTFLWRAAGSPEAKSMSSFVDVADDAYYAKAVAWAVEKGITGGTSATTFSPEAICTRAQIVTFLWRANGSPIVSGNSVFGDVAADAYYAAAVKWAEKNGITGGIGGGLFGSDNTCTRAQIVTVLHRAMK